MTSRHILAAIALTFALCAQAQSWTLQQCIDWAREHSITVAKNRVTAEQAKIDLKDARANRLPTVSFTTRQEYSNRPFQSNSSRIVGDDVVTIDNKNVYSGSYGINASMPLYDGGKTGNTIKRQELNTQIAQLRVDAAQLTIEEDIATIYVQLLYAQETVVQDQLQVALSEQQLERGKAVFQAGMLNRADVSQLESQLANDRYQLVADQMAVADYKLRLKQLLELDGDTTITIADPMLTADVLAPLPLKSEVYAAAVTQRPEVRAQQLAIDCNDIDVKIARASKLPQITLNAGLSSSNSSGNGNMFTQLKNQWNNSVGVTLNVPIWDHGRANNAMARARLDRETALLNLSETQKNLWRTIENHWQNATSAQQRYIAAQQKVEAARTSFELTSEQFRLGLKNILELTTDKTLYSASVQQMLQAKYMAILNAALLRYYGGQSIAL